MVYVEKFGQYSVVKALSGDRTIRQFPPITRANGDVVAEGVPESTLHSFNLPECELKTPRELIALFNKDLDLQSIKLNVLNIALTFMVMI